MNPGTRRLALRLFHKKVFLDKRNSPTGEGFLVKAHEGDARAPLSPFYLNLRTPDHPKGGPLTIDLLTMVAQEIATMVEVSDICYEYMVGIPHAGTPLADTVAELLGRRVSLLHLEKEEGEEGRRVARLRQGSQEPNDRIILIDDVISGGDSKLEALTALEEHGLIVEGLFVLVDREQGGAEMLRDHGYRVFCALSLSEMLDLYKKRGLVTPALFDEIRAYLEETT